MLSSPQVEQTISALRRAYSAFNRGDPTKCDVWYHLRCVSPACLLSCCKTDSRSCHSKGRQTSNAEADLPRMGLPSLLPPHTAPWQLLERNAAALYDSHAHPIRPTRREGEGYERLASNHADFSGGAALRLQSRCATSPTREWRSWNCCRDGSDRVQPITNDHHSHACATASRSSGYWGTLLRRTSLGGHTNFGGWNTHHSKDICE
jgi:hypothetical protein